MGNANIADVRRPRIERSKLIYLGATAGTRTAGVVMRARIFDPLGGNLIGRRTVSLPRAAKNAAKQHLSR